MCDLSDFFECIRIQIVNIFVYYDNNMCKLN